LAPPHPPRPVRVHRAHAGGPGPAAGDDMSELPDDLRARIDEYLDGTLDADGLRRLEEQLRASPPAQDYFVRYAGLHSDLFVDARTHRAAGRALATITPPAGRRPVSWAVFA